MGSAQAPQEAANRERYPFIAHRRGRHFVYDNPHVEQADKLGQPDDESNGDGQRGDGGVVDAFWIGLSASVS